jgi:branched-chain amino acid transport system substrate-binding protein
MKPRSFVRIAAAGVALSLVVAACGSDEKSSDSSAASATTTAATTAATTAESAATASSAAATSAEDPATSAAEAASGTPIAVGFVNQEKGSGSTFPDIRVGADAAVELINEQGGINGHPLVLEKCETDGSPEASQACANQMIEKDVVAVATGIDYGGTAGAPIVTAAGIPYFPTLPTNAADYGTEGVFNFFGGSAGQYVNQVSYIKDTLKATKVGVLVINVPQGVSTAEGLVKTPLEAAGIPTNVVPADPNTADFTPMLTAIMREKPDVITVLFTGPPCGQIMQARGALGITVPTLFPSGCIDKDYLAAGGAGAEGVTFSVESLVPSLHEDDPDVVTFLDAMKRFGGVDAAAVTTYQQVGYINIFDLAQVLRDAGDDVTPASVITAAAASKDHASPMAGSYTCDGSALAGFPTICNAAVRFVQREGDGFTELTPSWVTAG